MASIIKVNTIQDATNSNKAMTIDSSGRPAFPNRVAFEAWYTGGNIAYNSGSNAVLTYNNVVQQGGTNYSTSTGKFTVPITGFYCICLKNNIYYVDAGNGVYHGVIQNGTGFSTDEASIEGWLVPNDTGDQTLTSTFIRKYTAGDTLQPYLRTEESGEGTGRTNSTAKNYTAFSGFLIG